MKPSSGLGYLFQRRFTGSGICLRKLVGRMAGKRPATRLNRMPSSSTAISATTA
jgi:hypothetical protein